MSMLKLTTTTCTRKIHHTKLRKAIVADPCTHMEREEESGKERVKIHDGKQFPSISDIFISRHGEEKKYENSNKKIRINWKKCVFDLVLSH